MTMMSKLSRKSPGQRLRWPGFAALLLVTAGTLLAACGGDPAPSHTGGSGQPSGSQSGIKFAACMRASGIPDFPDSAISVTNGRIMMDIPSNVDTNSAQFQTAERKCRKDLPSGGNGSSGTSNSQALIKFANCMRAHGVTKFPEPNSSGRETITGSSGINPNSPTFQSAMQSCQHLLPAGAVGG